MDSDFDALFSRGGPVAVFRPGFSLQSVHYSVSWSALHVIETPLESAVDGLRKFWRVLSSWNLIPIQNGVYHVSVSGCSPCSTLQHNLLCTVCSPVSLALLLPLVALLPCQKNSCKNLSRTRYWRFEKHILLWIQFQTQQPCRSCPSRVPATIIKSFPDAPCWYCQPWYAV